MSHRYENERFPRRPVNKATMDEPQEEFIEPYAAIIEPDEEPGGEWASAAHPHRLEALSVKTD